MRWHRFFCEEKLEGKSSMLLSHTPLVHQIRNVFRLKTDDVIVLFDNSGSDYVARIVGYEKDAVSLEIMEVRENKVTPARDVYLFAALVKKDTFEWISEKATELGVSHIVPIIAERSEKKDINPERLRKIIIEASEQSGRATIPVLCDVISLEEALVQYKHIPSLVWDIKPEKHVSQDIGNIVGAYIGPEGGWSEKERALFERSSVPTCSLGPQVLRAETAAVAVLSQLVF